MIFVFIIPSVINLLNNTIVSQSPEKNNEKRKISPAFPNKKRREGQLPAAIIFGVAEFHDTIFPIVSIMISWNSPISTGGIILKEKLMYLIEKIVKMKSTVFCDNEIILSPSDGGVNCLGMANTMINTESL